MRGHEADSLACGGGRLGLERLECDERLLGRRVDVRAHQHLAHAAPERRDQRALHLHCLDHGDDVAGLDHLAGLHRDRDDDARREVADEPAVVAGDAVRDAVDLDEHVGALRRGQRAVGVPVQLQSPLVRPQPLDTAVDRLAVDLHAVARRGDLRDRELVGLPPVA